MLFAVLLLRRSFVVRTWGEKAILDQFGFDENGSYEFIFSGVKANFVFASLCDQNEYNRLINVKSLCKMNDFDLPKISQLVKVVNDSAVFSGTISNYQVLYPIFSACNQKHAKYKIAYTCKNKSSLLDSRIIPCLITKPMFLFIYSVLGIIWVINWVLNCRVKNSLHVHFTGSIFSSILFLAFQTLEIFHFSVSEEPTFFRTLRVLFRIFQLSSIFSMILMIASGLCSIFFELPYMHVIKCSFIGIGVMIPSLILDMFDSTRYAFRIECVSIFVALRLFYLLKYIELYNSSTDLFFRDNKIICLDEIKEKTKEFKRFRDHWRRLFAFLVLLFIILTIDDLKIMYYWVTQLFLDCVLFIILCNSGWICRLQSVYLVIETENLENRNGIKWEMMKLEDMR